MAEPERNPAMERLDAFIGTWTLEAVFPNKPGEVPLGQAVFEWMKGRQLLIERAEMSSPDFPDALHVVAYDPATPGYTRHFFDSNGAVRLYAMTFDGGRWTLTRTKPDFSALDAAQRYIGAFSDDGTAVRGTWESSQDGQRWTKDFDLAYVRIG
jgi:hypothetical protein